MTDIPITFEHRRKKFTGHFGLVAGAGSISVWHLGDDKGFYLGRLRKDNSDDWVFDESYPKAELKYLDRFFGSYLFERS